MENFEWVISEEDKGMRIDKFIALKLGEEYSRTYVKNLIDDGFLRVDGNIVKPHYHTKCGDVLKLVMPPEVESSLEGEDIPLSVLYEDDSVIVVDKPAGMVVHPACGNWKGTLVNALIYRYGKLPDSGNALRPGIVHRLDKDTSGVIIIAKNDKALRSLARQFQKKTVKKRYVAVVEGVVEFDNGVVDAPLGRHLIERKKMDIIYENGKDARTIYHVVRRFRDFTLLRLELETGRTHQIRVHMKSLGHPVLGDRTYGRGRGIARQALHAELIGVTHPVTGRYIEFFSRMPDDIIEVIRDGHKASKG